MSEELPFRSVEAQLRQAVDDANDVVRRVVFTALEGDLGTIVLTPEQQMALVKLGAAEADLNDHFHAERRTPSG